jgi:hypothetical protein
MGYARKTIVWLVVLGSLVWLTTATAKSGSSGTTGKDESTQSSGNSGHGNGNGKSGSTGPAGATGPTGTTGGQGSDDNGKGNGQADPPELGVSMGAEPSGQVKVKLPGDDQAKALDGSQVLPIGTVVDTRDGKIELTTALDSQGHTQTATFWGGTFRVGQRGGYTEIALAGPRPSCPAAASARIARRNPPEKRSLWGHDNHGHYRTRGQNSVATVRGTTWVTVDSCIGTKTRVTQGAVVVKDRHTHRAVVVKAGHSYLARARHTG